MSDGDGGTGKTEAASLAVASVALVVATVALLGTTAQVLQQYLATAVGYSNCGERVMGKVWARHTRLVFHPWELRFEVVFSSPEISVEPRDPGQFNATGLAVEKQGGQSETKPVADYTATWLTLLSTAQDMETQPPLVRNALLKAPPYPWNKVVQVQAKARIQTLDLMPEGVKKPYATTTFRSVINLAALMGIHWKQFDRVTDRYIADGNGLLLAGSAVPHVGIMFTFTRHGVPKFSRTRVVPAAGIVELSFGLVPTIFQKKDAQRPQYLTDVCRDIRTLRLGSLDEISRTLALLRWDKEMIAWVGSADHLFPVLFEVVAMLGRTLHIQGTPFRMLPNPLPVRWDYTAFSPLGLLHYFAAELSEDDSNSALRERAMSLHSSYYLSQRHNPHPEFDPIFLDGLHRAVDWCDELLLTNADPERILLVVEAHFRALMRQLKRGEVVELLNGNLITSEIASSFLDCTSKGLAIAKEPERLFMALYFRSILHVVDQMDARGTMDKARRIWLVLVFRMVCWLNLHTFHSADVQLPKSDMMGSQMPVYIS